MVITFLQHIAKTPTAAKLITIFTARCTLVQSSVLGSHVVSPSVRPSVSVTLIDCDDIGWNSSKIISRLVSLVIFALRRPQRDRSTPRGTPQNYRPNGVGVQIKVIFGTQKL